MGRSLLDVFNEDFIREVKEARRYPEAFDSAKEKFEKQHGFTPFESYDSFRMKKSRKRKNK